MSKYQVVLFDLDGTLIDTSEGIFNSVRYAEKMMGFSPIGDETLKQFVGPPPTQSYMKYYAVAEDIARQATTYHREYGLKHGIYEAEEYEGISELLKSLKDTGVKLGVCTLKRQDVAEKVLEYFGLLPYFDVVVGIDKQESLTKADTINLALRAIQHENKEDVVLVGDSEYDAVGAQRVGVEFLGVLYGFGLTEPRDHYEMATDVCQLKNILFRKK